MPGLRTAILTHSMLKAVPCCLCGSPWDEQLVGVALLSGESALGDLCPRCLSHEPAAAAARLKALWGELLARGPGGRAPTAPGLEELGERVARVRRVGERLRSLSRRIRALSGELRAARGTEGIEGLVMVVQGLAGMGQWGTTVPEVIEAERRCFRLRLGRLDESAVRRAVDDRYREFLAAS